MCDSCVVLRNELGRVKDKLIETKVALDQSMKQTDDAIAVAKEFAELAEKGLNQ